MSEIIIYSLIIAAFITIYCRSMKKNNRKFAITIMNSFLVLLSMFMITLLMLFFMPEFFVSLGLDYIFSSVITILVCVLFNMGTIILYLLYLSKK